MKPVVRRTLGEILFRIHLCPEGQTSTVFLLLVKQVCAIVLFMFVTSSSAMAEGTDVVFDIDQTIATLIHDGPGGDLIGDSMDPATRERTRVTITYQRPRYDARNRPLLDEAGRPITETVTESYRIYEGVGETLQQLKSRGDTRLSFFSGGSPARNEALLRAIELPDETSAWAAAEGRAFSREDMTYTGAPDDARVRDRFKKDLERTCRDLRRCLLVDDIRDFVPESQRALVLNLDEAFRYPERIRGGARASLDEMGAILLRERHKFAWIGPVLNEALDRAQAQGLPLSQIVDEMTQGRSITPITDSRPGIFSRGRLNILRAGGNCNFTSVLGALALP